MTQKNAIPGRRKLSNELSLKCEIYVKTHRARPYSWHAFTTHFTVDDWTKKSHWFYQTYYSITAPVRWHVFSSEPRKPGRTRRLSPTEEHSTCFIPSTGTFVNHSRMWSESSKSVTGYVNESICKLAAITL